MSKTKSSVPPTPMGVAAADRPKRYDDGFKRQAVEIWLRSGRPGTQVARELGIRYPALKDWKRRYYGDATPARADLEAENRALKAELQRVREQRDILKKPWASSPRHPSALPAHPPDENRPLLGRVVRGVGRHPCG